MQVGLKDIARELGVSVSLVSKVLSGRMGTSGANPAVVNKIRRTAARLGYRRNRTASALASGKHGVIAVYIHQHGAPGSDIVETLTVSIAEAAAQHDQRLWLQYFHTREEFLAKAGNIHDSGVDGLIVSGVPHLDLLKDLRTWQAQGLPIVSVYSAPISPCIPNVGCPDDAIGRMAVEHLVAKGCRHIGHIGPDRPRHDGFVATMAAHRLTIDPRCDILTPDYHYATGVDSIQRILAARVPVDGILAQSDHLAMAAIQVLLNAGLAVPDKVRIIGVDNSPLCGLSPVPMTSVSQQFAERGRRAVDMLMRCMEGEACDSEIVPPVVYERQSA